jgi:hypothetical protein
VSWNGSLILMTRRSSSSRAAWMSETMRCNPVTEPGTAEVTFLPKMIEQGAGRRELNYTVFVTSDVVQIEPTRLQSSAHFGFQFRSYLAPWRVSLQGLFRLGSIRRRLSGLAKIRLRGFMWQALEFVLWQPSWQSFS